MRILLDTHIYLWWLEDSAHLTPDIRKMIEDAETVYISSASLWEAIIKIGLGKLQAVPSELLAGIHGSGFEELPIRSEHTLAVFDLDSHHKDPFDRMLVAQAITEPLHLLTVDSILASYSSLVIVV